MKRLDMICRNCGNQQKSNPDPEIKNEPCGRCKERTLYKKSAIIRRHYRCGLCEHIFKISELNAIYLWRVLHEQPHCPACRGQLTRACRKYEYLKFSGQLPKRHTGLKQTSLLEAKK